MKGTCQLQMEALILHKFTSWLLKSIALSYFVLFNGAQQPVVPALIKIIMMVTMEIIWHSYPSISLMSANIY